MGPEIVLSALASRRVKGAARTVVLGDEGVLRRVARKLKYPLPAEVTSLSTLDIKKLKPGRPTRTSSRAMLSYIEEAVCMAKGGDVDAVVTAPISKEAAGKAGFRFPGHTEFLAHLTGTKDFAMMLGGDKLKVVLVTIHEPLRRVPRLITGKRILKTLCIADESFRKYFGVKRPRIAVAGLNPHAGEGGLFGDEERRIIAPAIKRARVRGINATGPFPADTVFYRAARKG
ncbi:MAG: 4-hydroxythreonine-4-phosphate dehydrogenase PdxA, partial [Thermodesulfobacteriota bacterium]